MRAGAYCIVEKRDRDRALQWLAKNTAAQWGAGGAPWPVPELSDLRTDVAISITQGGGLELVIGLTEKTPEALAELPRVSPRIFCETAPDLFPIIVPRGAVEVSTEQTEIQYRRGGQ